MKSSTLLAVLFGMMLFVACTYADCGDAPKDSDDGEVKSWFKNLGCKISKGAEDLSESAKPWADKIGSSAKELGSTIAQKYDEVKHKLTDDNSAAASSTPAGGAVPLVPLRNDAPTEKIPLAPLSGDAPVAAPAAAATGEKTTTTTTTTTTTANATTRSIMPDGVDQRFLFQTQECPSGQVRDHTGHCRPSD